MTRSLGKLFQHAGLLAIGLVSAGSALAAVTPDDVAARLATGYVPFIENKGQIATQVAFYARTLGGSMFVTDTGELVYALPTAPSKEPARAWAFREVFTNGQVKAPAGVGRTGTAISSYKGADPQRWRSGLTTYEQVDLGQVYAGITVKLQAAGNNVEKLFYVAPGANPERIRLGVDGVKSISLDDHDRLILNTDLGDIAFTAPIAYQIIDGAKTPVEVAYVVKDQSYGFSVGDYDASRELVIDPLLASTYIGGYDPNVTGNYNDDIIYGVVAQGGYVYAAGVTQSPDFPVTLGLDDSYNGGLGDAFVTKLTDDLSTIVASTFLGTSYRDAFHDLTVDANGFLYAGGQGGYGFPLTPGGYTYNGSSVAGGGVVVKLSNDLMTLVASAVVVPGAYVETVGFGNGGVYFGGRLNNPGFPASPDAYDPTCGSDGQCDPGGYGVREYFGFVGKLDGNLQSQLAGTYLDGKGVTSIAVANDSSVFITDGFDYAINGFMIRLDDTLSSLLGYVEHPGRTYFHDVAVADGYVIAAGQTYSADLPSNGSEYDTSCGSDGDCDGVGTYNVPTPDAFVARYSYDLQTVQALTYLGGSGIDSARSLVLDANGDVVVTGETASGNFPTSSDAFDRSSNGGDDGFVTKLSADLSALQYSSYLGGSDEDRPRAVTVDESNAVYVAGNSASSNFPTTAGAFDRTYNGGSSDAFLSKFDTGVSDGGSAGGDGPVNVLPVADAGPDQTVGSRVTVYLDGRGSYDSDGQIVAYRWTQVSGKNVSLRNADSAVADFVSPRTRWWRPAMMEFELIVTDDRGGVARDRIVVTVR